MSFCSVFGTFESRLWAQCSSDDGQDSFACQLQPAAPTQQNGPLPAITFDERSNPGTPAADHSTLASAAGSLAQGPSYTEEHAATRRSTQGGARMAERPLTEFQRFVAATTGDSLAIFGMDLFNSPVSFASLEHAPAPADMIVGPEDELRIRSWGQVNFSANLRVSREGEIYLPKVGAVHVAGLPFSSVEGHLREAMARVFRNFEISVDMGEIHSIQIYVTGHAQRPGEYTVSGLSTLVDAVFASGGPSSSGSMRHIELKRNGTVITDFDLYALLVAGDKQADRQLQSGDVLFIPSTGPQVALLGSVRQAGIYELRGAESINQLIETAGGSTPISSGAHISIERIVDHAHHAAFDLSLDAAGRATPLADGDIVRIDPIVSTYSDTVTLRGSVASPGRFRWHQGMHLSDLMPEREALVSRDYWWHRVDAGLPTPEFTPLTDEIAGRSTRGPEDHPDPRKTVHSPVAETDWNYAVVERLDPASMTTSLIPFDLGKLVLDHDSSQNLELRSGDVVTVFSQDDIRPPVALKTTYVRLEGEIVHPGVYSVVPGETLRSLVLRAGGLTKDAYLFGTEFSRKSTQVAEQLRLNEYANQLEHEWARDSLSLSNSVPSGPQGGASATPVGSVNRQLLAQLHNMRASGRIVLHLPPDASSYVDLPDTSLEDGDRLIVPSTPATVQVIGSVANQSAFLYQSRSAAADYLRLAGGPGRDADRGRIFVIRADGSIARCSVNRSMLNGGRGNPPIYRGDTIVVPEKGLGRGVMRGLLGWGQLATELLLGSAAINSIR